MPARDGYSAQQASVPYTRAMLYDGLPAHNIGLLDDLMGNALSASSMAKVDIVFEKYWKPIAETYGWPEIIKTDDPERGGKLVTFVLKLLEDKRLVADSIQSYVWGLRWKMKLAHQADPVYGLMNWHHFMTSVRVRAHVPHEPRRALPLRLIIAMLATIDVDVFWEVQFGVFMIILLGTFSRSECPCPKTFTGKEKWDPTKHWMVQDILIKLVAGTYVLAVRFKKIKQDRRIERAEARGDHRLEVQRGEAAKGGSDWSYVGDAPGHALSPFLWYQRLMRFYSGPRPAESPFFMAKDRVRPYTYSAGLKDLQGMLTRVSPDDTDFALHGIRVEGWNRAAADNAALAEAHGGWKPGNASRYSRFQLADFFTIFPKMVSPTGPTDVPTWWRAGRRMTRRAMMGWRTRRRTWKTRSRTTRTTRGTVTPVPGLCHHRGSRPRFRRSLQMVRPESRLCRCSGSLWWRLSSPRQTGMWGRRFAWPSSTLGLVPFSRLPRGHWPVCGALSNEAPNLTHGLH